MKLAVSLVLFHLFFLGIINQGNSKPEQAALPDNWKNLLEERTRLYKNKIQIAEQEILASPESAEAHFKLAEIYAHGLLDRETQTKAVEEYLNAIRFKPNFPEAYLGLALAYTHLFQYDEAYVALHKAISLKPDYAEAYSSRSSR